MWLLLLTEQVTYLSTYILLVNKYIFQDVGTNKSMIIEQNLKVLRIKDSNVFVLLC